MRSNTVKAVIVATLFTAVSALAADRQLSMPLGNTTTLSMPAPVSNVIVDDPSLLEVRREGRNVILVGIGVGTTEATIVTVDGTHTFHIYVASSKYGLP